MQQFPSKQSALHEMCLKLEPLTSFHYYYVYFTILCIDRDNIFFWFLAILFELPFHVYVYQQLHHTPLHQQQWLIYELLLYAL